MAKSSPAVRSGGVPQVDYQMLGYCHGPEGDGAPVLLLILHPVHRLSAWEQSADRW